jgi:hypothetical protein
MRHCHLNPGFQQCKSFVEMWDVRFFPLCHPVYCPMGCSSSLDIGSGLCDERILLLLFLQKQSLVFDVYLFGIGTLLTRPGLKKNTCDNALTITSQVHWWLPYSLGELCGVPSLLPVNPSQCSLVQVINTNVKYFLYWRSWLYDCHDLYLPSVPASLQTWSGVSA